MEQPCLIGLIIQIWLSMALFHIIGKIMMQPLLAITTWLWECGMKQAKVCRMLLIPTLLLVPLQEITQLLKSLFYSTYPTYWGKIHH